MGAAREVHVKEIIVDNFAGGGGASLGIEQALGRSPDVAVNHDPEAVAMHAANHPQTHHLCGDVWEYDPVAVCKGRGGGMIYDLVCARRLCPASRIFFRRSKEDAPGCCPRCGCAMWTVVRWRKA